VWRTVLHVEEGEGECHGASVLVGLCLVAMASTDLPSCNASPNL
jgi:hypothetical protein